MKKYPYVFLGIFISVLVFFIVHIISINIRMNRVINVKEFDEQYSQKIENLKKDAEKIKDDSCKSSVVEMANRIIYTIPRKGITLQEYYGSYYGYDNNRSDDDGESFLYFYSNVATNCNIDNNEIYNKVLESLVFPYEMKNRYIGSYQIGISDTFIHKKEVNKVDELGSYSTKMLELEVLSKIMDEVEK